MSTRRGNLFWVIIFCLSGICHKNITVLYLKLNSTDSERLPIMAVKGQFKIHYSYVFPFNNFLLECILTKRTAYCDLFPILKLQQEAGLQLEFVMWWCIPGLVWLHVALQRISKGPIERILGQPQNGKEINMWGAVFEEPHVAVDVRALDHVVYFTWRANVMYKDEPGKN